MSTRALVQLPARIRRGELFELRCTIAHPMESGQRRGGDGQMLPRDIIQRFEARLDGQPVFTATLHPAIAANPFIAFWLRAERGVQLGITALWREVKRLGLTLKKSRSTRPSRTVRTWQPHAPRGAPRKAA